MAKTKKLTPEEQAAIHAAAEGEVLSPEEYQVVTAEQIWGYDDTGHNLSLEEQLFVRSYIIDRNPVAALRRLNVLGDSTSLLKRANRYLANSEVEGAINALAQRLMDKLDVTAERIQRRLAGIAFFDIREVMEFDHNGMKMLHSKLWPEHAAAAIQSVKMTKEGVELKVYDGLRATEMLAKQIGLQPDETPEAARIAGLAASQAVIDKIMQIFDRTVPDDPAPQTALPAPDEATKH